MLLTADDLAELTGKVRPAAQRRVLDFLGITYEESGDRLKVRRYDVLAALDPDAQKRGALGPAPVRIVDLWSKYLAGIDQFFRIYRRGDQLPAGAGVYLMIDAGAVHYVGQTVNICSRMLYHHHAWWQELVVIEMPDWWPDDLRQFWLDGLESLAMDYFKPQENLKIAPGMRGPESLLAYFERMPREWRRS